MTSLSNYIALRETARLMIHDLVERATTPDKRPGVDEVSRAIRDLENSAVNLAHAVRQHTLEEAIAAADAAHRAGHQPTIYYWPGKGNRRAVLVVPEVDHTLTIKSSIVCRVVERLTPLSLGHKVIVQRLELQALGPDMQPIPKAHDADITQGGESSSLFVEPPAPPITGPGHD